jgi:DNA polymerase III epsilon subunit-like protein
MMGYQRHSGQNGQWNLNEKLLAIDVECVATGTSHSDRAVAAIAAVNEHEQSVFFEYVKPEQPVRSCLTPLTGLTFANLENAASLPEVLSRLKNLMSPMCTVIVGHGVHSDIKWLGLQKGVDFKRSEDTANLFRFSPNQNQPWKQHTHSLRHICIQLLGFDPQEGAHSPDVDARCAMRVFNMYGRGNICQEWLAHLCAQLAQVPAPPPFWSHTPYIDGCEVGAKSRSVREAQLQNSPPKDPLEDPTQEPPQSIDASSRAPQHPIVALIEATSHLGSQRMPDASQRVPDASQRVPDASQRWQSPDSSISEKGVPQRVSDSSTPQSNTAPETVKRPSGHVKRKLKNVALSHAAGRSVTDASQKDAAAPTPEPVVSRPSEAVGTISALAIEMPTGRSQLKVAGRQQLLEDHEAWRKSIEKFSQIQAKRDKRDQAKGSSVESPSEAVKEEADAANSDPQRSRECAEEVDSLPEAQSQQSREKDVCSTVTTESASLCDTLPTPASQTSSAAESSSCCEEPGAVVQRQEETDQLIRRSESPELGPDSISTELERNGPDGNGAPCMFACPCLNRSSTPS